MTLIEERPAKREYTPAPEETSEVSFGESQDDDAQNKDDVKQDAESTSSEAAKPETPPEAEETAEPAVQKPEAGGSVEQSETPQPESDSDQQAQ